MFCRLLIPLCVSLVGCAHGRVSSSAPESLGHHGPWRVMQFDVQLQRGDRPLPTTVWHPHLTAPGRWPLIIYSHGFQSTRFEGAALAAHLASHGFVVMAATYPNTNIDAKAPQLEDVVNQPPDASRLIDAALEWNDDPNHRLAGRIDPTRIGATGVSLGGLTTALLTYHRTLRDPRVKAALTMAAPTQLFTSRFFARNHVPWMAVYGTHDAIIDQRSNARPLRAKAPFATLVTIEGGSHAGFADLSNALAFWAPHPDALACAMMKPRLPKAGVNPFAKLHTEEGDGLEEPKEPHLPCENTRWSRAMRPVEQQEIIRPLVLGFFSSRLAAEAAQREAAAQALSQLPALFHALHFEGP